MESERINTIYMMGIGGIAMGTLATMLKEKGYNVVGSDQNLYPPMSTHLEALKIPVRLGYDAQNLGGVSPDVVIIGNVIRRENPEAVHVLEKNIPYMSMPQAIGKFLLAGRESVVVTGTHGKSTTSSLVASVLTHGGLDPSAFIGAFVKEWQRSYRLGNGRYVVLEGDEYDTAFFDKGAKFLHYRPKIGIMTGVEFDHADIFADFEAVLEMFRRFVNLIPEDGCLIANADDENCLALARECNGKVTTYGFSQEADWRIEDVSYLSGEVRFTFIDPVSSEKVDMVSKLAGRHNLSNALSAIAVGSLAGLSMSRIQEGILRFGGVTRRQDLLGESNGVLIMDDFAHHPTAVRETIGALRLFYPERRILAAFEPRTNSSRRRVFQEDYAASFDEADCTCIKLPPGMEAIPETERLDTKRLVMDIRSRKKDAHYFESAESLLDFLVGTCRRGDLVLCMSNGSFDGIPLKLLDLLNGDTRKAQ